MFPVGNARSIKASLRLTFCENKISWQLVTGVLHVFTSRRPSVTHRTAVSVGDHQAVRAALEQRARAVSVPLQPQPAAVVLPLEDSAERQQQLTAEQPVPAAHQPPQPARRTLRRGRPPVSAQTRGRRLSRRIAIRVTEPGRNSH